MAIIKYIDGANLAYAFNKIKALISTKANADLSNVDKDTLAAAVEEAGVKNYTHPTTSGNKHIPSGGSSGQILKWLADGVAHWADEASVTVDDALSSSSTNPVQNKVVNTALAGKMPKAGGIMTGELEIKATSSRVTMTNPNAGGRYARVVHWANSNAEFQNKSSNGTDYTTLILHPEDSDNGVNFLEAVRSVGGQATYYDVLHTGNIDEHAAAKSHEHTPDQVGAVPTGGVDKDFSEYTSWADLLDALPVGSVTMVRIAEINDALVPADCPNTAWASFVIRKPNTVYQTCSVTLHAYTENGPRIFEGIFAQGTAEVGWMEVAAVGHTQAASTITAGTFGGQVVANASNQTPGTSLLRNSKLVSSDTNPSTNGEINWTYK